MPSTNSLSTRPDMENTDNIRKNPWLGLRTYTEGEVIYGRSREIETLGRLVLRSTQTVVYGRSGIGKSSLLAAGVFPLVRRAGMLPVYIRLEHNAATSYLEQIKAAVSREFAPLVADGTVTPVEMVPPSGEETLWEYFHRMEYRDADGRVVVPMLVFDQFEEIFTLETSREKRDNFFRQLADQLNNVMPEALADEPGVPAEAKTQAPAGVLDLGLGTLTTKASIYKQASDFRMIFTLREDFLSYLERSTADIPDLKNNRYCLQPINEEQAAEIIMQPRRGLVSKEVAHLIISRVTGESDFKLDGIPEIQVDSAILSLYLSRLYDKMVAEGRTTISTGLVEAYSDNIIEDFYTDACAGLDPESVRWMEDTLVNHDGRRDNRDRATVLREGRLSEEQLRHLTDDVRLLRQFSYGGDMRVEYIHDVLCPVIVKRRNTRIEEQRIAAMRVAAERERRRARRNIVLVTSVAVAVLAVVLGKYLHYQYQHVWTVAEAYPAYELQNGWPVGIGPRLSAEEMAVTPRYYLLSKQGHSAPHFTRVTVDGSNDVNNDQAAMIPFVVPDDRLDSFGLDPDPLDSLLASVKRIDFVASASGDIDSEAYFDSRDRLLFSTRRYATDGGEFYSFTNPDGRPMHITDEGVDRVHVTLDTLGFIASLAYFDERGVRLPVNIDTYAFRKEVNPDRATVRLTKLDEFSFPLNRSANVVETRYGADGTTVTRYFQLSTYSPEPLPALGPMYVQEKVENRAGIKGYDLDSTLVYHVDFTRDKRGNVLQEDVLALPLLSDVVHENARLIRYGYDDKGRMTSRVSLDAAGDTLGYERRGYDADGEKNYTEKLTNGLHEMTRRTELPGVVRMERAYAGNYTVCEDSTLADGSHRISFFDAGHRPVNVQYEGMELHRIDRAELPGGKRSSELYVADEDGQVIPYADGFRTVETLDEAGNVLDYRTYDAEGRVLESMMFIYENGEMVGRAAMGIDGTPVRCPDWEIENFAYYKMYFNRDNDGQYTHLAVLDETGRPSVLYWPEVNNYIKIAYHNLKGAEVKPSVTYLDGVRMRPLFDVVDISKDYRQFVAYADGAVQLPGARFLHVLDRDNALYRAGLRDGDVIASPLNLLGASEIDYKRFNGQNWVLHTAKLTAPLTVDDLDHIHIHEIGLTREEQIFIDTAPRK